MSTDAFASVLSDMQDDRLSDLHAQLVAELAGYEQKILVAREFKSRVDEERSRRAKRRARDVGGPVRRSRQSGSPQRSRDEVLQAVVSLGRAVRPQDVRDFFVTAGEEAKVEPLRNALNRLASPGDGRLLKHDDGTFETPSTVPDENGGGAAPV